MSRKWILAKKGINDTQSVFEQLTDCIDPSSVKEWTAQERIAMEQRGEHLKIYEVKSEKCMISLYRHLIYNFSRLLVPSMAEIWLELSEKEVRQGNLSGAVATLTEGLAIEQAQYVACSSVRNHANRL